MRIGLVVCVDDELEKNQMFGIKYMPVWAYTLATYIREIPECEVFLYDTRCKERELTPRADFFFISGINQDYQSLISYQRMLRKLHPLAKIIIGGPITSSYKLINKLADLSEFDHIFIGDGEPEIVNFINQLSSDTVSEKVFEQKKKFKLEHSKPIDLTLLTESHSDYYGGVLEVSRGCPFLCEFCDIRTKPDNNTADNKPVDVIVKELENFWSLGITDILFACDNFIGNHVWAEQVCDKIIELKQTKGCNFHIYTWLTINLVYHPKLMEKMKMAGFDMFFIGVESFGMDQLLETAKLQNVKTDMKESIRIIQSHGFIIVAGMIFGFDGDPSNVVEVVLDGIRDSGLISGDPSLLTALPGTPLYRRMELSGRLRDSKIGLGGQKYVTNIKYLRPKDVLIKDFIYFVKEFNKPKYQFSRFENFIKNVQPSLLREDAKGTGYINIGKLWRIARGNYRAVFSIVKRIFGVTNTPVKLFYILKALKLTLKLRPLKMNFFYFWLFNWSNSVIKYGNLSPSDFDIDSVSTDFDIRTILPPEYETEYFEPIPLNKIKAQRQATAKALKKLIKNAAG